MATGGILRSCLPVFLIFVSRGGRGISVARFGGGPHSCGSWRYFSRTPFFTATASISYLSAGGRQLVMVVRVGKGAEKYSR